MCRFRARHWSMGSLLVVKPLGKKDSRFLVSMPKIEVKLSELLSPVLGWCLLDLLKTLGWFPQQLWVPGCNDLVLSEDKFQNSPSLFHLWLQTIFLSSPSSMIPPVLWGPGLLHRHPIYFALRFENVCQKLHFPAMSTFLASFSTQP